MIKGLWFWFLVTLCTWLATLFISWWLLAQSNFFYPLWYQVLAIDEHIAEFGPQNHYRQHFHITTEQERVRLFTAIVAAIHQYGQGLATLSYHNPSGKRLDTLLTNAEILHLQDVARLVSWGMRLGLLAIILWVVLIFFAVRQRRPPPLKNMVLGTVLSLAVIVIVVVILGPVGSFYWLHEQLFPDDHQWFFYYEESLLTTLLKAPDIFAGIVLLWIFCSIVLFAVVLLLVKRLASR